MYAFISIVKGSGATKGDCSIFLHWILYRKLLVCAIFFADALRLACISWENDLKS